MNPELPETQRLFIALYPDDAVRARLHRLALDLVRNSGARVVPRANLHLTLRFLGSVDAATQACLQQKLEQIRGQGFKLQFDTIEYRKRQQMLWANVTSVPDALTELVAAVEQSAVDCGLGSSDHPFRPHLTLARKVRKARIPEQIEIPETRIEEFCLVHSVTLPEGSQYTRLEHWPLNTDNAK